MFILVENDVVIAKSSTYEDVTNGHLINGVIYPMGTIYEIPEQDVIVQKHKYVNGQIVLNQDYMNRLDILIQEAIDSYTLELLDGGVI